jgi:hypothetical protein
MITYVLIDPRDSRVRYVGRTTVSLKDRLRGHMVDRCEYGEETWKGGWLGALHKAGLKPKIVAVSHGDIEQLLYDALRSAGHRIFNHNRPPRQRRLCYINKEKDNA